MVVLAQYAFTGLAAGQPVTPPATLVGTDVTASALSVGTGLNTIEIYTQGGYSTSPVIRVAPKTSLSSTTVFAANSYFEFTLSTIAGKKLAITNVSLAAARGGASTPRGFVIRSSLDNYAANLMPPENIATVRPTLTPYGYDLSAFPQAETVTFRIYVYAASAATVELDDITISGTVVSTARFASASASLIRVGNAVAKSIKKASASSGVVRTPAAVAKSIHKVSAQTTTSKSGLATAKSAKKAVAQTSIARSGLATAKAERKVSAASEFFRTGQATAVTPAIGKHFVSAYGVLERGGVATAVRPVSNLVNKPFTVFGPFYKPVRHVYPLYVPHSVTGPLE